MTQEVSDRPAERSLNITNVLLSVLIGLGSIFGTTTLNSIENITESVKSMEGALVSIQVSNGVFSNDIQHNKEHLINLEERIINLEKK